MVKNPPANAGDARDTESIPGLGVSPGGGKMAIQSSILAWKIPWTEKLGGLLSMGLQSRTWLSTHKMNSFVTGIKSLNVFSHFQVHLGYSQK